MKYFSSMKCWCLAIIMFFLAQAATAQDQKKETVLFGTDEWTLSSEHKNFLSQLIENKNPENIKIEVSGFTDDIGENDYNLTLSEKRAESVKSYFISLNIPENNITLKYFGEARPVGDNQSATGRKSNRRVEISIKKIAALNGETVDSIQTNPKLSELYEQLSSPPVSFCYVFDHDTVIVGEQGTIFYFRKNSFNVNPDTLTECIKINYKERFKKSDIIFDNLSTTSNGDILITQGMIYIDATYKGEPVIFTKDITVFSPTDTLIPEMTLFDGHRDEHGNMNWIISKDTLNGVEGNIFSSCGLGGTGGSDEVKCPFFFCKIGNFFQNIFSSEKNSKEDDVMEMSQIFNSSIPCEELRKKLDEFQQKYGDMSVEKLKDIPKEDLKYYVFNRRSGWSNTDWMTKINDRVRLKVLIEPDEDLDIKIVFEEQNTIIPMIPGENSYYFNGLPRGYEATLVALKFEDGQPALAFQNITLDGTNINALNFETFSIPELKEKLKFLDK